MKWLIHAPLAASIIGIAAAHLQGGLWSSNPELEPQEVFQAACDRLKALEAKHEILRGVSKVKPRLTLDEENRFQSAGIAFEVNATPPGKNPAKAKDEGKPFFFVSVQVWSGDSQQPPANLQGFTWKGKHHSAWVQVYGSDAELVKTVRRAVAEPILAPVPKK